MTTALSNIPLFSGFRKEELEVVSSHLVTRSFPKNSVVVNEGDTTDSLYVILSGKVKVFLTDEEGNEVILRTQGPGEYFGELALVDEAPRSASVMTLEPSKFSIISSTTFTECMYNNPTIAIKLIKDLCIRVRALTQDVKSLALLDVYGRIARTLLELANPQDGKLVIEEKLTHRDIANRIGASREMVSRIMKDLTDGGYIATEGKKIIINENLPHAW